MTMSSESRRLNTLLGHLKASAPVAGTTAAPAARTASPSYRYTLGEGCLTAEQRRHYEENGFLVIRGLVSPHSLDTYRDRFKEICMKKVKVPGLTMMKDVSMMRGEYGDGEAVINKIQDFQHDEVLLEYCKDPAVLRYVECFTGPDIMAMHTMLINKPPDTGTKSSRHPMHQDLHYFPFRPADRIVCSWTAMEHVHRENGCLVVLPGTHKTKLLPHSYPQWEGGVNKMYHGIMDYDPSHPRVHLEMQTGDTVFFHPLLIHGSGRNRTKGFRKAISCHYASSHCNYIDVSGTSQDVLQKEVMELAKRRVGKDAQLSFDLVWKIKGVCVQGNTASLSM